MGLIWVGLLLSSCVGDNLSPPSMLQDIYKAALSVTKLARKSMSVKPYLIRWRFAA